MPWPYGGMYIAMMTDSISPEHRSWVMGRIRSRNTKPEIMVRSLLHRMGYRFTLRGPSNRRLPGRPDIVLPRHRAVVFVHGCFWHRHRGCRHASCPKSRAGYWQAKFAANVARDQRHQKALWKLGWRVLVVWECEARDQPAACARRMAEFLGHQGRKPYPELPPAKDLLKAAEARADYRLRDQPPVRKPTKPRA